MAEGVFNFLFKFVAHLKDLELEAWFVLKKYKCGATNNATSHSLWLSPTEK